MPVPSRFMDFVRAAHTTAFRDGGAFFPADTTFPETPSSTRCSLEEDAPCLGGGFGLPDDARIDLARRTATPKERSLAAALPARKLHAPSSERVVEISPGMDLHVRPRLSMTWEEFTAGTPRGSVALDGFVRGGPAYDAATGRVNFDHHESVIRDITMSTAKQVYHAIRTGLLSRSASDAAARVNVFINDCDQDTALAVWLLAHHDDEALLKNPRLERFLELNDRMDITGGAFPLDLSDPLVAERRWVFEPYAEFRKSGRLAASSAAEMTAVLDEVLDRLTAFVEGRAGTLEPDYRHDVLYRSARFGFVMAHEIGGNDAREGLFANGMNAFINLVAVRPDGRRVWAIGRRSKYVDFPVTELYRALNAAEGLPDDEGWGGSDLVGGSSRERGSRLDWREIADVVEKFLESFSRSRSFPARHEDGFMRQ